MTTRVIKVISTIVVLKLSLVASVFGKIQSRTVTDFYLELPGGIYGIEGTQNSKLPGFEDDFFFYSNERNESRSAILRYRKSLIKIEDVKNGYLRLESDQWKGWVEIALFKKADGSNLIAISQVTCAPGCKGGLIFANYKNSKWRNVTAQVFPDSSAPGAYYKLPRLGTSIELVCGDDGSESCRDGKTLGEFEWDKEKFIKKPSVR